MNHTQAAMAAVLQGRPPPQPLPAGVRFARALLGGLGLAALAGLALWLLDTATPSAVSAVAASTVVLGVGLYRPWMRALRFIARQQIPDRGTGALLQLAIGDASVCDTLHTLNAAQGGWYVGQIEQLANTAIRQMMRDDPGPSADAPDTDTEHMSAEQMLLRARGAAMTAVSLPAAKR